MVVVTCIFDVIGGAAVYYMLWKCLFTVRKVLASDTCVRSTVGTVL